VKRYGESTHDYGPQENVFLGGGLERSNPANELIKSSHASFFGLDWPLTPYSLKRERKMLYRILPQLPRGYIAQLGGVVALRTKRPAYQHRKLSAQKKH